MNITHRPPLQKPPRLTSEQVRAGKRYMARVKALPCIVCGAPAPSDAHHCTHRPMADEPHGYVRQPAAGKRSSDFDVIPLCKAHHQDGPDALHNGKERWREQHGPDFGFIPVVRAMLSDVEIDF